MNRKILFGLLVIGLISALAGAGLYAYFSDTKKSTGNKFTAGTCTIELSGEDGASAIWTFDNLKPGDTVVGTFYIENTGSLRIWDVIFDVDIGVTSGGGLEDAIRVVSYNAAGGNDKADADVNLAANRPYASPYGKSVTDWTVSMDGVALEDDDDLLHCNAIYTWNDPDGCYLDPTKFLAYEWTFTFPDTGESQDDLQGESFNLILSFEARTTNSASYPGPK